jgi:hypothetical protein
MNKFAALLAAGMLLSGCVYNSKVDQRVRAGFALSYLLQIAKRCLGNTDQRLSRQECLVPGKQGAHSDNPHRSCLHYSYTVFRFIDMTNVLEYE